ncbi:hypothetical protein [Cupriavidus sp. UYPR2.512]|uniref:hypothetical protein n=1 Tax=Cupriavidus sp. UYPR2.512 TaxID=1080187 RepID=UPI00036636CC|nr:hypothetical protein [Cupriavidus sp. UYPR2.512]UIF90872.1 hypothetical protein KAF44_32305 [Cupriavidus necator]
MTKDQIREIFLANGFTVKEGQSDLKQYVYDAAYALLERAAPQPAAAEWIPVSERAAITRPSAAYPAES